MESLKAPNTNELWLDSNYYPPKLKAYHNGQWKDVCESSVEEDVEQEEEPTK